MRIELVGSPGCGKTTLAIAFMDLGVNTCFESVLKNPYLEKSYSDDTYRFPAQLQFALMKLDDFEKHKGVPLTVYDQGLATSFAFSSLIEDVSEKQAAVLALAVTETRAGPPDFTIVVKCEHSTQLQRVATRGRAFEVGVTKEFLEGLDALISAEAKDIAGNNPVVEIDTTHWGFDDCRAFAYEFLLKHRLDMLCNLAKKVV